MLDLLDAVGQDNAIWVGHDWGSLAGHHPHRSHAAANRCVHYGPAGFTPASSLFLVDRKVYPEAECHAGQWDYQLFYQEHFDRTRAFFEANVPTPCRPCAAKGTPRGGASRREPHWCARRAAATVAPARHQPCRWIRTCWLRRI
jgi:pimeloyl-ACP methyl ester carboxylesterase